MSFKAEHAEQVLGFRVGCRHDMRVTISNRDCSTESILSRQSHLALRINWQTIKSCSTHLGTVMKSLSFQTSKPNGRLWLSMYFPERMASCFTSSDGQANSSSFHEYFSSSFLAAAQAAPRMRTKSSFIARDFSTFLRSVDTGKAIETEIIHKARDDFITRVGFLSPSLVRASTRQTGFLR
jgi:hypothetical protein